MVPLGSSVTSGEFWNPVFGCRVVMTAPGLAVEDDHAVDGRGQHVLIARSEVGRDDRADHPVHRCLPQGAAVGAVERVHRTGRAVVGALDDLQLPVAEDVGQRRAALGVPVERGGPGEVAVAVDRDQLVGVGLVVRGAGAEDDADGGRAAEELTDRREDWTVSLVLYWQSRPPLGCGCPALPVGLRILQVAAVEIVLRRRRCRRSSRRPRRSRSARCCRGRPGPAW